MLQCPNCGSTNLVYIDFLHLAECKNCSVTIWEEEILEALKHGTDAGTIQEENEEISQSTAYGFLKPDTPFAEIFPNQSVPLVSADPMRIAASGKAPPCLIVDGLRLTPLQTRQLARLVFNVWSTQCQSLAEAESYVKNGLPLKADWFLSVESEPTAERCQETSHLKT